MELYTNFVFDKEVVVVLEGTLSVQDQQLALLAQDKKCLAEHRAAEVGVRKVGSYSLVEVVENGHPVVPVELEEQVAHAVKVGEVDDGLVEEEGQEGLAVIQQGDQEALPGIEVVAVPGHDAYTEQHSFLVHTSHCKHFLLQTRH